MRPLGKRKMAEMRRYVRMDKDELYDHDYRATIDGLVALLGDAVVEIGRLRTTEGSKVTRQPATWTGGRRR